MVPESPKSHPGLSEGSVVRSHHYRCVCGEFFPIPVVLCVDAVSDPELAGRILSCQADRAVNQSVCPSCQGACFAEAAFSYHDRRQGFLVLVLPESYRHRELQERAALLLGLSQQESPLPTYAIEFAVSYGPQGLAKYLQERIENEAELTVVSSRAETEDYAGSTALVAREKDLADRGQELDKRTTDLDSRSASLTERELALQDRKAALDRRSGELEEKTQVLAKAKEVLRAESEGGLPAIVNEDATQALSTDDILTSAPDPSISGPMKIPSSAAVSGSSVGSRPKDPLHELLDEETPPPILLERKTGASKEEEDSEIVTDELLSLKDTQPSLNDTLKIQPKPPVIAAPKAPTDPDILAWCKRKGHALKLLRGHDVWLVASVPEDSRKELAATDIRALLQLHRMPSYPLVTLTLAKATTLGGQLGQPFSFHFDVGDTVDREMLEQLAKDFRFKLEVFGADYRPVQQRRLAAPLSTNVHFVVALGLDTLRDMPAAKRSFAKAMIEFAATGYDRLGRGHPLASEFKDAQLDKLADAKEVLDAISLCDQFSASKGEEYLVATRSYPYERWHQRRLRVLRKAIELGLWMGADLALVAVSEGLVRSARELLARCQNNFATFVSAGGQGLASGAIDRNWALLETQALSLGIGGNTTIDGEGASGTVSASAKELLDALRNPKKRIAAIEELSKRELASAAEPIARALAELNASEAPAAFAFFARLGGAAKASLLVFLDCPTQHLRHAAALAICELRDATGIDSISEALMSEEGSLWREYAMALGQVGATAIMPVVARVAGKGKREQARAVWALGYIAGQGGRKSIETLAKGKDATVAQVATSALELEGRLRDGSIATERDPLQSVFSEAFYASLSGVVGPLPTAEITGQAMQLDEGDLLEASDP